MQRTAALVALVLTLCACGGGPPVRWVLERDIGHHSFRRFQHVLDIEVPIQGNTAEGYTATYVHRVHDQLVVVTAFVTVYQTAASLGAEVSERVRAVGTYQMTVANVGGHHVWNVVGPDGDHWYLWVSGNRVVKVGGQNEDPPREIAEAYVSIYPSDFDEHGQSRPGTASVGASHRTQQERNEDDLPSSLREGAPR